MVKIKEREIIEKLWGIKNILNNEKHEINVVGSLKKMVEVKDTSLNKIGFPGYDGIE